MNIEDATDGAPDDDRTALETPPHEQIRALIEHMAICWRRLDPTETDDDPVGMALASRALIDAASVMRSLLRDMGDLQRARDSWHQHALTSDKQLSATMKERDALRSQLTAQEARAKELEADNKRLRSALNAIGDTLMGAARPKRDFTMHEGSILVTVRDALAPPAQSTQGSGEDG